MRDKTVLITGASRGVGLALTERAVSLGARVIATARRPEASDRLRALGASGAVEVMALDVVDEASQAGLAEALDGRPIDIVIANAGVLAGRGGMDDPAYDAAAWSSVLMTNVFGPFATVRALRRNLERAAAADAPAKVAVISSGMGSTTRAATRGGAYAYCASKGAATNLAVNLSAELAPVGIAVGAYHPGWVRTDMGGGEADISAQESAAGLVDRIAALSMATTGVVEDYRGVAVAL